MKEGIEKNINTRVAESENKSKEYTDFKVNEHDKKIVKHVDNIKDEMTFFNNSKG
ncbi:hypothetical protein PROPEN_01693 [Proteus penneri ATCC 35198]|nr:hypothetical protein PROPEN_01693 [Proteus penneri ATCC 35198]